MAGGEVTGRWAGRRVLITGHSGFVGTWLAMALRHLGADVRGFAANGDRHTRARLAGLAEFAVSSTVGDIRDFAAVHRAMSAERFDAVFHLAAQPLVKAGLNDPRGTLDTNVGGSINVLEAARLCSPAVLVHVTSDKCYRNQSWPWPYREIDDLGGGCPYSTSKAAAELVYETYAGMLTTRVASVRFGNVIGGNDFADGRLVPDVLAALRAGRTIRLRRPDAVRPWQHVLDVVRGLLLAADGLADGRIGSGDVFNFAPPGDGATVHELVAALVDAWCKAGGPETPVVAESGDFPEERLLRLDGRKAAAALAWRHAFDLKSSAAAVVEWEFAVSTGRTPIEAVAWQIRDFLATADGVARGGGA